MCSYIKLNLLILKEVRRVIKRLSSLSSDSLKVTVCPLSQTGNGWLSALSVVMVTVTVTETVTFGHLDNITIDASANGGVVTDVISPDDDEEDWRAKV